MSNNCSDGNCETEEKTSNNNKSHWLVIALLLVIPFEVLSFFSLHLPLWFELPLFLALIVIFGKDVFISGIKSIFRLNFSDINLLMTIAVLGAMYLQEFEEAAIIVILFALGNALEDFGIERSQTALKELVNKTPKSVLLKGKEEKTPIENVKVGDIVVIKPGDYIALDGEIVKGSSLVDETAITGEPLPKNKYEGDTLYGGTVNGQGYLEMRVAKEAKDTTLSKIINLTYESAEKKSHSQKFIEQFARYYTPAVMVIALLLVIVPVFIFHQPFTHWLTEALTLLLISCPCALVISTPITVFSAIGNASKKGVLIKGGQYLEELAKIKAIAFDKTRTLTEGKPKVSDVISYNGVTKQDLLACVAGMEELSEHPLAQSVVNEAKEENLSAHPFTNFKAIMGKGLQGECTVCTDKHHCMGNLKFITEEHKVGQEVVKQVAAFEQEGKTTIVISDEKKVNGIIGIVDQIREESKSTIEQLSQLHIVSIILTGDNAASARYVAKQVGIQEVRAELLPDKKVEELSKLTSQYKHVVMVGDGVNDAPALAAASVGIAMGAIGSDLAVENADIALMSNNLQMIPFLILLGKKSVQTIRTNVLIAILVKMVFLILALLGRSNIAMAIFADVGVTLFVVLNSLRLYGYKE